MLKGKSEISMNNGSLNVTGEFILGSLGELYLIGKMSVNYGHYSITQ